MASAERKEIYDVSLEKFYAALVDFEGYPRFVSGMRNVKILERQDQRAKVFFEVEMMKKVEYSIDVRFSINEAKNQAEVNWVLDSSPYFKVNNGAWKLQAKSPHSVEATYKLELEFTVPVPGLLLKGLVAKALPQAMKEFYLEAKK